VRSPDPADLFQSYNFADWHEDYGSVLWWRLPVQEPPYVGSPLDLGRGVLVTVQVGLEELRHQIGDVGGWPFDEEDEKSLVWTLLPAAIRHPRTFLDQAEEPRL
jgi:hypothetical protein